MQVFCDTEMVQPDTTLRKYVNYVITSEADKDCCSFRQVASK